MIVLVKKDLKPFVGDVSSDSVPVGLMGLMVRRFFRCFS